MKEKRSSTQERLVGITTMPRPRPERPLHNMNVNLYADQIAWLESENAAGREPSNISEVLRWALAAYITSKTRAKN